MIHFIQYIDREKVGFDVHNIAIDLSQTLPHHKEQFGVGNVAIYTDDQTKAELAALGIDCECIRCNFVPLDNHYHSMRWLSIMAMQTEPFQICPIGAKIYKRETTDIEVSQLVIAPYIPVLAKYGLEQTGGLAGGDIITVPNAFVTMQAYAYARDVIYENEITDEAEIQQLMGAFLFKAANDMNINITKYP